MSGGDGACAAHKEDAECCRSGGRWDNGSGGACSGVSRSNVRGEQHLRACRWRLQQRLQSLPATEKRKIEKNMYLSLAQDRCVKDQCNNK